MILNTFSMNEIGPFFVFAPVKQLELKKKSFLKTMATVAQKKDTRYVTFAIFVILTLVQALVAYGKNSCDSH
jgi:hypothetical protein